MRRGRRPQAATGVLLLVFLVTLIPRLPGLGTFITWDEPQWAFRAARFLHALETGNPSGTFLIGAPGVITMWCGALGMAALRLLAPDTATAWTQIIAQPSLGLHDVTTLRAISRFLVAAKIPLVILTALGIGGIFLLAERLLRDRFAALLAALLIAFNPFFLAHSRVFHTDAPATIFVMLSLLTLLNTLRERLPGDAEEANRSPVAGRQHRAAPVLPAIFLSGLFAGLAFLAKASTLPFTGIVGLILLASAVWPWAGGGRAVRRVGRAAGRGIVWGIGAALAFGLAWPAMWANPLGTLNQMFGLARKFAATPHAQNYFLGQAVRDPGPLFYPVSLAFRTTPIAWLGVLAALVLVARRPQQRPVVIVLLTFAVLYTMPLMISAKKFERYALPVYPALDIVAAIGLAPIIRRLTAGLRFRIAAWPATDWIVGAVVIAPLLVTAVVFHPYELAWANPLLGGASRATEWLPAGWGEGIDRAARYLNDRPDAEGLRVAVWGVPGFGPLFVGESHVMSEEALSLADFAVVYVSDVQMHSPLIEIFYGRQTPVYTATIRGLPYAWVYANDSYLPTADAVRQKAAPDETILFDAPTRSARALASEERSVQVIAAAGSDVVATALHRAAQNGSHLAYVQYQAAPERGAALRQLLELGALRLEREVIPRATIWHYQAVDSFAPVHADRPVNIDFGGQFWLTAVGLSAETVEDRRALGLRLQWEALAQLPASYHLFIHLLDETGYRWGQWDGPLAEASNPISPGQIGSGTHLIRPLPGLPPGTYHLEVGLYDPGSGQRLAAQRNAVALGTSFRIEPLVGTAPRLPRAPEELAIAHRRSWAVDGLRLLGFEAGCVPEQQPGDRLPVTLFWQAIGETRPDYVLDLSLLDGTSSVWQDRQPVAADHPTGAWFEGEVLRVPLAFRLPASLPGGVYTLSLALRAGTPDAPVESLPLLRVPVRAVEHTFAAPAIEHPFVARVEGTATLLGYELSPFAGPPPESLAVTLFWQVTATPDESYTTFVHLTDAAGHILDQDDAIPANGTRPTTGWVAGEIIADRHELTRPADAPAGSIFLRVGLYAPETGRRLTARDSRSQRWASDAIVLPVIGEY